MDDTTRLHLPLLQAAQAQKHVTVNDAMTRLDALTQLVLASRTISVPPAIVPDGTCYAIPSGAVNAWAGHEGQIAFGQNGGWSFVLPAAGWRAWIVDESKSAIHDGGGWAIGMLSMSANGAGTRAIAVEIDHNVVAGATSQTVPVIPAGAVVIGVTARVLTELSGTLVGWQLGTVGEPGRFGTGLGVSEGSWVRGVMSQPTTFYTPTMLVLSAVGGDFVGGSVRLAVHYFELTLPGV